MPNSTYLIENETDKSVPFSFIQVVMPAPDKIIRGQAPAGIQSNPETDWIPASAGMTEKKNRHPCTYRIVGIAHLLTNATQYGAAKNKY